jgi:hypothetical protein
LFLEEKLLPRSDFERLLLQAVDEGLSSLGDSPKQAIYFHLDRNFNIKKEQIPENIKAFSGAIERIFGNGANFLEIAIMKQLYEKVGGILEWNESARLGFAEYVSAMKRTFQERRRTRTMETLIECEETRIEV